MKIAIIAPNISENMSGEAIKGYQYLKHLTKAGAEVTVVTHARSRGAFEGVAGNARVIFVEDDAAQVFFWRSILLRELVTLPYFLKVRKIVREIAAREPDTVFHYLCPVSPILPRFPVKGVRNVLGPLTGNIYYPPAMRAAEPFGLRWRRLSHKISQRLIGVLLQDKARFSRILISGGGRTRESLCWAGGHDEQFADVLDSGISEKILSRPPVIHEGENYRFVSNGRLVPHKGVDLAIRAVARAGAPFTLDVFGKGPEEARLRALIDELGVSDRVRMRGWLESHDDLLDEMLSYRGFVFPSLAEANGIVVQEALAMGLPVICLNWGGPAVLTTDETARRIEPTSAEYIIEELAREMSLLASSPELAATRANAGLDLARARFGWPSVAAEWAASFSNDASIVEKSSACAAAE